MERIFRKLRQEFLRVLPPTIFFFVAFNVISINKALMLRVYGIDFAGFATATVGALLVGKVVLVADKLPVINRFPEKPLIYNVVWKTAIYMLAVFIVRYLEHLLPAVLEAGSVSGVHAHLVEEIAWPRFWSVQLWLFVLFFVYAVAHELVRLIGRDRMLQIFFGFGNKAAGAQS